MHGLSLSRSSNELRLLALDMPDLKNSSRWLLFFWNSPRDWRRRWLLRAKGLDEDLRRFLWKNPKVISIAAIKTNFYTLHTDNMLEKLTRFKKWVSEPKKVELYLWYSYCHWPSCTTKCALLLSAFSKQPQDSNANANYRYLRKDLYITMICSLRHQFLTRICIVATSKSIEYTPDTGRD